MAYVRGLRLYDGKWHVYYTSIDEFYNIPETVVRRISAEIRKHQCMYVTRTLYITDDYPQYHDLTVNNKHALKWLFNHAHLSREGVKYMAYMDVIKLVDGVPVDISNNDLLIGVLDQRDLKIELAGKK